MSKLSDALNKLRVFNNWDLMRRFGERGKDVSCDYSTGWSRGCEPRHTSVSSPTFYTDPGAHWQNHGAKWFCGNRSESLPLAMVWASEQYGIDEWVTSPFGGKVPKPVLVAAKAAVKAATK